MVWRALIGQHPTGHQGLFISKPGYDALACDPTNHSQWMFSSAAGRMANILQAGTSNLDQVVTIPDIGYYPWYYFDRYDPSSGQLAQEEAVYGGNYGFPRFQFQYLNRTQFKIAKLRPDLDPNAVPGYFRYAILALPIKA